jgi:hypothetical protein
VTISAQSPVPSASTALTRPANSSAHALAEQMAVEVPAQPASELLARPWYLAIACRAIRAGSHQNGGEQQQIVLCVAELGRQVPC